MNLIEAKNISLIREKHLILQDISMQIRRQDFLTIIGPNGAGKSSLLKCLIGNQPISSGQITKSSSLRIGYVPQDFFLDAAIPLSVNTFLYLVAKRPFTTTDKKSTNALPIQKLSDAEIISLIQTENLLDKPMLDLSAGQLQRVLLTRTLLLRPNLLILDEPAKSLDLNGQIKLYQLLDTLHEQFQIAILMVSHDLHLVMSSSREVICLSKHVCCSGKPQDIATNQAFLELFGSDIAKQLSIYHHDLKHHLNQHHNHD